jgi:hypothetical protein
MSRRLSSVICWDGATAEFVIAAELASHGCCHKDMIQSDCFPCGIRTPIAIDTHSQQRVFLLWPGSRLIPFFKREKQSVQNFERAAVVLSIQVSAPCTVLGDDQTTLIQLSPYRTCQILRQVSAWESPRLFRIVRRESGGFLSGSSVVLIASRGNCRQILLRRFNCGHVCNRRKAPLSHRGRDQHRPHRPLDETVVGY